MLAFLAALILLAVVLTSTVVDGRFPEDSVSLLIAIPLTKNNVPVPDPGWLQLASALIAIDHFNERNTAVVPQLASLKENCNITIGDISVLDTGTNNHLAIEDLLQFQQRPHAIVGPYNEIPALELSVLATTLKIPIVAHRAVDSSLLLAEKHPYFSQVNADPLSEMDFLARYLNHTGRTNFIAVVYSGTASVMQKVNLLRVLLDKRNMDQVKTFSYQNNDGMAEILPDVSIRSALRKVKQTGFRTIVCLSDDMRKDAPLFHEAASEFQLDRGDHFWVVSGGVAELSSREQFLFLEESRHSHNFLKGSAFLTPYDGVGMTTKTTYEASLLHQNRSFVERLEALTPIANYYNWSYAVKETIEKFDGYLDEAQGDDDTLARILERLNSWWFGASYIYDATMAVGIGACEAVNGTTGKEHLAGIRSVDFSGATGRIAFTNNTGSRLKGTEPMAVVNLLPPTTTDDVLLAMTEIRDPSTGGFVRIQNYTPSFVYADGSLSPAFPLRDTPEQNYLKQRFRIFGLFLMLVAMLAVALSVVWVHRHRDHAVVIASPSGYLYELCLGAAIVAFDIWVFSHDESQGWDKQMLSTACVTSFWLKAIGVLVVYGALFTKHWRVDLLIRRKSNQIGSWRMAWPSFTFSAIILAVLACCTATSDYGWYRVVVDDATGESVGYCRTSSERVPWSFYVVAFLLLVPIFHAATVAYRTLGMDELYADSKWVLVYILLQIQVFLVGAPVQHILAGVSPDGTFVGSAVLCWTISVSTVGLIIFPKIWKVRQMHLKANEGETPAEAEPHPTVTPNADRSADAAATASTHSLASPTPVSSGPRIQMVTFD